MNCRTTLSVCPLGLSDTLTSNTNSFVDELTQNHHLPTHVSFCVFARMFFPLCDLPSSSLFLSKANSTSTGQLDKLVSAGLPATKSEEEHSLPPQRVSTFRPRPYSMADSNKVRHVKPVGGGRRSTSSPHSASLFTKEIKTRHNNGNLVRISNNYHFIFTFQITAELVSPQLSPTR